MAEMREEHFEVMSANKAKAYDKKVQLEKDELHRKEVIKLKETVDMLEKQKSYLQSQLRKKQKNDN
tara:strand:- start:235 stop:432 length:198 start_codon:yes stop_codon:yes gene_type:complete